MKQKILVVLTIIFLMVLNTGLSAKIIRIPGNYAKIQDGINAAESGDTILIASGTYYERLLLTKELTIASNFIMNGEESAISETIIDGQTKSVFTVTGPKDGISTITGLTIRNGEDGLIVSAPVNLLNNLITGCEDGIDYETGGGGLCKNNIFINNSDDGVDLDGTLHYIIVENNIIADNDDDGIEIRLHSYKGNPSYCRISNNEIYNNKEDGIQFIDYPDTTLRTYLVERNLIYNNSMAGIAFMDKGDTKEDYRGALIPEPIYVFNNTISGNNYGITGGGGLIALNNIVVNSRTTGILNASGNTVTSNNLFFENGIDTVKCSVNKLTNLFKDPKLSSNFVPGELSPCIDNGIHIFVSGNDTLMNLNENEFSGRAPDIGALEYSGSTTFINEVSEDELISIFPNPFHDYFEVVTFNKFSSNAHIINESGQILKNLVLKNKTYISTANFPDGIYFLRYYVTDGWKTQKIIKI